MLKFYKEKNYITWHVPHLGMDQSTFPSIKHGDKKRSEKVFWGLNALFYSIT